MATVLKVSLKQWVKYGMPATTYDKLVLNGYQPKWKAGGGITLSHDGLEEWGLCAIKKGVPYPDQIFTAKYEEVTGEQFLYKLEVTENLTTKVIKVSDTVVLTLKADDHASNTTMPPYAQPASPPAEKVGVQGKPALYDAEEAGILVSGSSSVYTSYLISDDCNIAYRFVNNSLSIRAEKFTPAAKQALMQWGLVVKSGARPYASTHVSVTTKDILARTLGSLAASVLTKPAKSQLMKASL